MNLGTIWAEVRLKTDKFNADVNAIKVQTAAAEKSLDTMTKRINTSAQSISRVGTSFLIAGAAITAALGLCIKEALEEQRVMAQTAQVIKSTGGAAGITAREVKNLADSFQSVTPYSNEVIQSGQNLLLTFTKIGKDIFPQATEIMLDMSIALGQDLKGSAIQLGKALQDPILGVTALRRVGVNFNEAQTNVIKKLVETGHAAEAQAMIMKELQVEFGGSARAAGQTLGGQLAILKNQFMDLAKTAGYVLFPVLQDFIEKYIKPLIERLQAIPPHTLENIVKFTALAGVVLLVGGGVLKLVAILMTFATKIMWVATQVKAAALIINAALGPIGWVIAGITAAVALLVTAWTKDWGGIREKTQEFVNWFTKTAVPTIIANIKKISWARFVEEWKGSFGSVEERAAAFNKEMADLNSKAIADAQKVADKQDEINERSLHHQEAINKSAAAAEINLAKKVTDAEILLKQKSVKINEQLTSEQINDELEKLQAAQKQKERQAWLDAEKEKLLTAETEEDKAAIRKEVQSQLDAWQYEDTVDSYKRRQTILDKATQDATDAAQKVADEEKRLSDLVDEYAVKGAEEAARIDQERADKRQTVENNLAGYLKNIYERERDDAVKSLNARASAAEKAIQREIDARYKQYQKDLDLIYKERDARLGVIDKRISSLEAQHEREARATTMADLQAQLVAATTEEDRANILKEIRAQTNEWTYQDTLARLRAEQDAIRVAADAKAKKTEDAYSADKVILDKQLKDTQDLYDKKLDTINKYYDDLELARNLDAEVDKLLATKTMTEILAMMNASKSQWAKLGSEIGDVFWSNLMSGITSIEDLLKLIGHLVPPYGAHYAFAEGGAVYGPTLALLGENATPSNPEIIIPPGGSLSSEESEILLREILLQLRTLNVQTMPDVKNGVARSISGLGSKAK